MPGKLSPGTPSMWKGTSSPCQWIDVSSWSRLVTLSVTSSPSRKRRSGPGRVPLIPVAIPSRPLMRTGNRSISRSNRVPVSEAMPRLPALADLAQAGRSFAELRTAPAPSAECSKCLLLITDVSIVLKLNQTGCVPGGCGLNSGNGLSNARGRGIAANFADPGRSCEVVREDGSRTRPGWQA